MEICKKVVKFDKQFPRCTSHTHFQILSQMRQFVKLTERQETSAERNTLLRSRNLDNEHKRCNLKNDCDARTMVTVVSR
jgi:hypothetical protein